KVLPWIPAGLALFALLVWILPRLWVSMRTWREAQRLRYRQSEAYSFKQFSTACKEGAGASVYAALQSWAGRAKTAPLSGWLRGSGESAVLAEYEKLESALFAARPQNEPYDAAKLFAGIADARQKWLKRRAQVSASGALPPLNP